MKLVSVDDHVVEHPQVWVDRLPAKYREVGPTITETSYDMIDAYGLPIAAGNQVWEWEGRYYPQVGTGAVAGKDPSSWGTDPVRYDDMRPGYYDPVARLADMDIDGVDVELCFPTFPRFAGTTFLDGEDKELALLCVRAYNDFIVDEWCAVARDRQIPLIITPLWDPQLAADEVRRCADKGAKAITFPENPVPLNLPSFHTDHWDPLLAAAQETGMPLCLHFGTSRKLPITAPDAPHIVLSCLMGTNSMAATADLLFSPILHRFPNIKVALSEGGVGWIPYLLERIDHQWERHRWWMEGVDFSVRPSDLFRQHIWGCFIEDEAGLRERYRIGIDQLMWEADYPHGDGLFPHTRQRVAELFADVPDGEVHAIVELNARRLFDFPAPVDPRGGRTPS